MFGPEIATAFVAIRPNFRGFAPTMNRGMATAGAAGAAAFTRTFGRTFRSLFKSIAIAIVIRAVFRAVTGAIRAPIAAFEEFNQKMTESQAIMGDLSSTQTVRMEKAARRIAKATTFTAAEAAESFFFLASAGLNVEQSLASIDQVSRFAQAGMFDMAKATDLATDAQSALGLKSSNTQKHLKNMTRVTDVLVKANQLANATVEQFSEAMTNFAGPALKAVGKDIEEGASVLAVFADQGIKGRRAGRALSIVMRDLQTKAIKFESEFKKLNVAVFDGQGEMRNMADIISDLEVALDGMSDKQKRAALAQLGFTDRSIQYTLALLGTSNQMAEYEEKLRSAAGATEEVANKQLESMRAKLQILGSHFVDIGITMGQEMEPAVVNLAETIIDNIGVFEEWGVAIAKRVSRAINWFSNRFIPALIDFREWVEANVNPIFDDFFQGLERVIGKQDGLWSGFTSAIEGPTEALSEWWDDKGVEVLSGFQLLGEAFGVSAQLIEQGLGTSKGHLDDWLGGLQTVEGDAEISIRNIALFFATLSIGIAQEVDFWSRALGGFFTMVEGAADFIGGAVIRILAPVTGTIRGVVLAMEGDWKGAMEALDKETARGLGFMEAGAEKFSEGWGEIQRNTEEDTRLTWEELWQGMSDRLDEIERDVETGGRRSKEAFVGEMAQTHKLSAEEWRQNRKSIGATQAGVNEDTRIHGRDIRRTFVGEMAQTHLQSDDRAKALRKDVSERLDDLSKNTKKSSKEMRIAYATELGKMVDASGRQSSTAVDRMLHNLDVGAEGVETIAGDYAKALAKGLNPVIVSVGGKAIVVPSTQKGKGGRRGRAPFLKALRRAEGGIVPGSGPDADTIPAMLSPGEFVVRRKAVDRFGVGFLEKLNALSVDQAQAQVARDQRQPGNWLNKLIRDRTAHYFMGGGRSNWTFPSAVNRWANIANFDPRYGIGRNQVIAKQVRRPTAKWYGVSNSADEIALNISKGLNATQRMMTAVHEIGHTLGLKHTRNRASIMYPGVSNITSPTSLDKGTLRRIYPTKRATDSPTLGMAMPDLPKVPDVPSGSVGRTATVAMRHARSEAQKWLEENIFAGGGLGGLPGPGRYKQMFATVKRKFPSIRLISGFRPGAITATGNRSYHSMGRAIDINPWRHVFNWIRSNFGRRTKELIFSPAGFAQIHNGRPHYYTGITRKHHFDHIHWAMNKGGFFKRPTRLSGTMDVAEKHPEIIAPEPMLRDIVRQEAQIEVRVFIGNKELSDIAKVEVKRSNHRNMRRQRAGG